MEDVGKGLRAYSERKGVQERYTALMNIVLADTDVKSFIQLHKDELTQEDIEKSYPKLYEFVQEKKKFLNNDPTMIAPGYEPQLILNFHYIDVAYVPTETLLQQRMEEEVRKRINLLDLPRDIQNASISGFENTSGRGEALISALDFIESYKHDPRNYHKGLYLVGSFGVGKTYLLGAIAHELAIDGFESTIVHFPTFAVTMKNAIDKGQVGEKMDVVKKAPILMLDDIGADSLSSWLRDDILGVILQHRMQEQLPTLFSSNFTLDELEKHLSTTQKGEHEPLKAKRIMERIRYLAKEIEMTGKNRRNG